MLEDEEPKENDTEEYVNNWIKKFNNAYLDIVSNLFLYRILYL